MTPRTEPMPFPVPEFIKAKVCEVLKAETLTMARLFAEVRNPIPDEVWLGTVQQFAIARLLWERGEPEPVDPDVEAVKRIIRAWHHPGLQIASFPKDHLDRAVAAYKAEKART
jgi:hypothetical protein